MAIRVVENVRRAEYISRGEVLEVVHGPRPHSIHIVEVRWKGSDFTAFSADIQDAGEEIVERL